MKKSLSWVTIAAAVVTILSSGIFLLTGRMLPGLSPISLAVVMGSLALNQQYTGRQRWLELSLWAIALLNVAAGIMQIVVSAK